MLIKKRAILLGAAIAAMPVVSKATTISLSFGTFQFATSSTGPWSTAGTIAGTAFSSSGTNYTATVPAGDFVRFNLIASTNGPGGIYSVGTGITDDNKAASGFFTNSSGGLPLTLYGGSYTLGQYPGSSDGNGGIGATNANALYASFNATNKIADTLAGTGLVPSFTASGGETVGGASTVFSHLAIQAASAGTAHYTPSLDVAETGYMLTAPVTTTAHAYKTQNFTPGTDALATLPVLTVVTTGGGSTNKIISLTSTQNGTSQGTLTFLAGAGGPATPIKPPANNVSGYVNLVNTNNGYVLLDIAVNGNTQTYAANASNTIAQVITDINTNTGITSGAAGYAVPLTGALAQYQGSYDLAVYLGSGNASTFAYDFSAATDTGAQQGVSVVALSAVPEPATAAGIILGAAGLLLGRRKSRIVA